MKISLIHPSRGRPEKSLKNSLNWIHSAGCGVQLIVSIDVSDHSKDRYIELYHKLILQEDANYNDSVFVFTANANSCVVEATNRAAMIATGDILIYLSDDFDCPENWAELVLKEFEDATGPRLIKVDDMLQPFHVKVLTIPIMNRALYEKLGYFWHPEYKSMHVDCDLYETVKKIGALKMCPHLKFEHKHVSVGKAPDDETYRRSSANWKQGEEVFNRRKRQGFPV